MIEEQELLNLIKSAENDAVLYNNDFSTINRYCLERYLGMPYGDEEDDRSRVLATDTQDVVESDIPSLARVFLGANDIISFESLTSDPKEIKEAEEKTIYTNWIVRKQKESFKTNLDFLKDIEIHKMGILKFTYEDKKQIKEQTYKGFSELEWTELIDSLEKSSEELEIIDINGEKPKDKILLTSEDEVTFKIVKNKSCFVIKNVPPEKFLISRNSETKEKATLIGDTGQISKGELIAMGFDKERVKALPRTIDTRKTGELTAARFYNAGGGNVQKFVLNHWTSEEVTYSDLYILIDYDEDGLLERRRFFKVGEEIFINEIAPIVPYAIASAVPVPHSIIGRGRAELVLQTDRINTVLTRQMLDNIYNVNNGRVVTNPDVTEMDDLLVVRHNGVIRTEGDPQTAVYPLITPFIGNDVLQVIQYQDSKRAQSTGTMLSNQGLDADKFYNETATRYEGMQNEQTAKIEMVARCIAEIGYRDLYEGLAELIKYNQKDEIEILILGKPMTINPGRWMYESSAHSIVGLGAGDNDTINENLSLLLSIQKDMKMNGSLMVDDKKIYNNISRLSKNMGIKSVQDYFNDPDVPDEILLSMNEQLRAENDALKQQVEEMKNPLAEAERIKAQADLIKAQSSSELKIEELKQELFKFKEELKFKYSELEVKEKVDVEGYGIES